MEARTRQCAWCWPRRVIRGSHEPGDAITGIEQVREARRFFMPGHAAGAKGFETSGGRVLGVTAPAAGSCEPRSNTPTRQCGKIHFDGMHYRRDIGRKGLEALGQWYNELGDVAQMDRAVAS